MTKTRQHTTLQSILPRIMPLLYYLTLFPLNSVTLPLSLCPKAKVRKKRSQGLQRRRKKRKKTTDNSGSNNESQERTIYGHMAYPTKLIKVHQLSRPAKPLNRG